MKMEILKPPLLYFEILVIIALLVGIYLKRKKRRTVFMPEKNSQLPGVGMEGLNKEERECLKSLIEKELENMKKRETLLRRALQKL